MINLWTEVAGHWIQPDIIKAIHPVTYDKYEEKWHITFAHEARFGLTDYAIWCKTILDEPTANLSVPVARRLLELMRDLKGHGVAQIIISHRLQDIFEVGDRVMVLKRGRHVGERRIDETSEDEILGLIVAGDAGLDEPG